MNATAPFIDVDGHIAEPQDLWQTYIEPQYRDRTLQILKDSDGLEYLSIDGMASWFGRGGTLGALCAIGQDVTRKARAASPAARPSSVARQV